MCLCAQLQKVIAVHLLNYVFAKNFVPQYILIAYTSIIVAHQVSLPFFLD